MNKLIIIKAMQQVIDLYLNNSMTLANFENIIDNLNNLSLNEEQLSYEESIFISDSFTKIPYYILLPTLTTIFSNLQNICQENPKLKFITQLMQGYISELLPSLLARLSTEISGHIAELLEIYYQTETLDPAQTITRFKKNIFNPQYLASTEAAESFAYQQQTINGIELSKENLRETVSRTNFYKKARVERATQNLLTKFYDEGLYQKLLTDLKKVFASIQEKSEDMDLLKDELITQLTAYHHKAKKKWDEVPEEDPNQIKLILS